MRDICHIELFDNGHRIYETDDAQTDSVQFRGTDTPQGTRYDGQFTEGPPGEDFITHFEGASSLVIRSPKR